ncbi:hypothetical protein GW796_11010, partial [archaeon]|nr:hypothetical protein [archaeon]
QLINKDLENINISGKVENIDNIEYIKSMKQTSDFAKLMKNSSSTKKIRHNRYIFKLLK